MMAVAAPHLSPAAIRFLQQLKRNNDRDWFNARKDLFVKEVQEPWLAVVEAVNQRFLDFAPEYVRPARRAALRIYRDIRFSKDKRPYKTNVAAWWSTTTTERTSGGGYYAHVSDKDVIVAAGVYMPLPAQLLAIRRHLQEHHEELRGLLCDAKRRKLLPDLDNNPLTRMPKGFLPDDPAGDMLLYRQWALSATLPVEMATSPKLLDEINEAVPRRRADGGTAECAAAGGGAPGSQEHVLGPNRAIFAEKVGCGNREMYVLHRKANQTQRKPKKPKAFQLTSGVETPMVICGTSGKAA